MQDLKLELARLVAGSISREEFHRACGLYLDANPDQRNQAAHWFREGVDTGRIPTAVWDSIADLFGESARAAAPGNEVTLVGASSVAPPRQAPDSATPGDSEGPAIGAVLKSRYRLVEELGRGGMGQVFKAVDRNLERAGDPNPFVALKALKAKFATDLDARDALQFEAMRAMTLSHDNIIRVHDFDWDGAHVFITMEYLKGSPLDELIQTQESGGLDLAKAWPIIESIGNALEYGHRKGVIHSDVKPSNVFITRRSVVKVLDFGISRPMAKSAASQFDTIYDPVAPIAGLTPAYASLEQWTGEPPDPRDDVYSFALVIYELLRGHHPFASASAKKAFESGLTPQRIDKLSRAQWDGLRHALALQREQRTKTVKELLLALQPQTLFRKYRAVIFGGLAVATAVALGMGVNVIIGAVEGSTICPAPTPHPPVILTSEQQKEINDNLFLAQDYLKDVKLSASPEDLAYVLSEGANNVNQILDDGVLKVDPDNGQALKMKDQIADLYLGKARELFGRRAYAAALNLVEFGRKVGPCNRDLYHLQNDLRSRAGGVRGETPATPAAAER